MTEFFTKENLKKGKIVEFPKESFSDNLDKIEKVIFYENYFIVHYFASHKKTMFSKKIFSELSTYEKIIYHKKSTHILQFFDERKKERLVLYFDKDRTANEWLIMFSNYLHMNID